MAGFDIGSGFNTTGVVRLPMEAVAAHCHSDTLNWINNDRPEGPKGAIFLKESADVALSGLMLAHVIHAPKESAFLGVPVFFWVPNVFHLLFFTEPQMSDRG